MYAVFINYVLQKDLIKFNKKIKLCISVEQGFSTGFVPGTTILTRK